MNNRKIYILLLIFLVGIIGMYFFNKYNVAPKIDLQKLQLTDDQGKPYNIQSLKGQKVIVSFYASWCPNCIEELKTLNSIKDTHLEDITVLAITDEPMEKLLSFKAKKQYPFTFVKLQQPFNAININSIPTTYLLNTKGEVVYNKVGYIAWDDESNLNYLKKLME